MRPAKHSGVAFLCLLLFATAVNAGSIQLKDDAGYQLSLDTPARRVVALAPHIVENVYAAGAGDTLVAAVSFSNYPQAAKLLPQVGSFNTFSVEAILAHKPDLVIAWGSGNSPARLQQLRKLGVPVYVSEPKGLQHLSRSLRHIGQLTGHNATAQQRAHEYDARLKQLRESYWERQTISVFYQIWNQPLQTLGGTHWVSDVLSVCGGKNIFADAPSLAPKINIESVLQRDPQVILASGMDRERPEWLDEWLAWPALSAVKNRHLFFVPPDLVQRHTVRVLDGTEIICRQLQQVREHFQSR